MLKWTFEIFLIPWYPQSSAPPWSKIQIIRSLFLLIFLNLLVTFGWGRHKYQHRLGTTLQSDITRLKPSAEGEFPIAEHNHHHVSILRSDGLERSARGVQADVVAEAL